MPANFIQSGDLIVVDSNFSVFNSLENNGYFEYVLRLNLVKDANLAELLDDPTAKVKTQALAPQGAKQDDGFSSFGVPFAVLMIFYLVITMTGGFMLQSVSKEKENRTIEVLLLSLRPRDLMLGKILGLGVVALLQIVVWGGVMLIFGGVSLNGLSSSGPARRFLYLGAAVLCAGLSLVCFAAGRVGRAGALDARRNAVHVPGAAAVVRSADVELGIDRNSQQRPDDIPEFVPADFARDDDHASGGRVNVPIEQLLLGLVHSGDHDLWHYRLRCALLPRRYTAIV